MADEIKVIGAYENKTVACPAKCADILSETITIGLKIGTDFLDLKAIIFYKKCMFSLRGRLVFSLTAAAECVHVHHKRKDWTLKDQ